MTRMLFIAAGPPLLASLSEQFEALGGFALRALDDKTLESVRDAPPDSSAIIDGDFCDAAALIRQLLALQFAGIIVVIGPATEDADAVLTRPFRFADLLARLAAPGRRKHADDDLPVRLTEKEAAILARLTQAEGAIIPKAALLADVWGYGPNVTTRTLETHIHRLRRKIETDPRRPRKLLTEDGGYRLAKSTT
ncbi:MAG: winged helix-turn-helix domain-containing protein [Methylocystis sp.]|uniref:winged helix-turn-helix domain-containing protein n=1 Tax=Methylocystis sp. TaxID=1911079 RepID=UPI003DA40A79